MSVNLRALLKAALAFTAFILFWVVAAFSIPWLFHHHFLAMKVFTITLASVEAAYVAYVLYKIFEAKERRKC